MNRRTFLELVGQTGGAAAVHGAMRAMHLADPSPPVAFDPHGRAPRGARVIVLGAGLAGLATAYELQKLGYETLILEARPRSGGRCFSARQGTVSEEVGPGKGQTCRFEPGLYLNAGPMRIPHHHTTTLGYCRELGVPVELFCSVNEASYVHDSTATDPAVKRMRLRQVKSDWRGYTSELLAKALSQEALNASMTAEDRDRIIDWLRRDGALGADLRYVGSPRRGYKVTPGAGEQPGAAEDPLALAPLVRTGFGGYLTTDLNLQWPMFQPVGGMDRIAKALTERVQPHLKLGAEVLAIEQPNGRVRVKYRDAHGATQQADGAYCVCALPLSVLRDIPMDIAPAMRDAIRAINYASAGKIGMQFKRRFWEEDEGIFGGITRTDLDIAQIVYPSYGFLGRKGLLIGYYQTGATAAQTADKPAAERQQLAVAQGAQIHPQYPQEFENAFSVAWQKVPYNRGSWAQFSPEQRKREYVTLLQPDRNLYLAGDHLTYQVAWMQGAFESARSVTQALHQRASRDAAAMTTQAQN